MPKDSRRKLSDDDVRAIRRAYDYENVSQSELARRYNVAAVTVHAIVHRVSRANVEDTADTDADG